MKQLFGESKTFVEIFVETFVKAFVKTFVETFVKKLLRKGCLETLSEVNGKRRHALNLVGRCRSKSNTVCIL